MAGPSRHSIYQVPQLILPAALGFSLRERRLQRRLCRQLQAHAAGLAPAILQVIEVGTIPMRRIRALHRLSHPLSAHALQRRRDDLVFKSAEAERKYWLEKGAYERWCAAVWSSFGEDSPGGFIALLGEIGAELDPLASRFRLSPVGTLPDKMGNRRRFPEPHLVHDGLTALWHFVRAYADAPAVIPAAVMHYGICVLHPFGDGNGRLARMLFNVLVYRGNPHQYIPLRHLFNASDFGYEIRLHEMDETQHWEQLIRFFQSLLLSYHQLYRKALRGRQPGG